MSVPATVRRRPAAVLLLPAVLLGAAGATAAARAAPAAPDAVAPGAVVVRPAAPAMVLGTDDRMTVTIESTGVQGDHEAGGGGAENGSQGGVSEPLPPPRLLANVGRLLAPERLGPRRFAAVYLPPPERFPQIAIIVAEMRPGGPGRRAARGVATIALHGKTDIAMRTDPGAMVTLRVGEAEFGPVHADRDGKVQIPTVVPPGAAFGRARSTDRLGNTSEREVDLQPTAFNRLLLLAPEEMEAGAFSEVSVYAVEAGGAPTPSGDILLRSSGPLSHALGGPPGEARFAVEAPESVAWGPFKLLAIVPGKPDARTELAIPLRPGPVRRISLEPLERRLVVGSGKSVGITVAGSDRYGNPTAATGAKVAVDGHPVESENMLDGRVRAKVTAPARYPGRDLRLEATLGGLHAETELRLAGDAPARVELVATPDALVADGRSAARLEARVLDRHGTPTASPSVTWRSSAGSITPLASPREGVYLARFKPALVVQRGRAVVEVTVTERVKAVTTVEIQAPFPRIAITARAGYFNNLGELSGPATFLEATVRTPRVHLPLRAGIAIGYLRGRFTSAGAAGLARVGIDQVPLLAIARYRFRTSSSTEASIGAGVGVSFASTFIDVFEAIRRRGDRALATQVSVDGALALGRGQAVLGVRWLDVELGRISDADAIRGNTAGLVTDLGYRFGW